jgi:hypothetical protein
MMGTNVTQASSAIKRPENSDALENLQTDDLGGEWAEVVKKWESMGSMERKGAWLT